MRDFERNERVWVHVCTNIILCELTFAKRSLMWSDYRIKNYEKIYVWEKEQTKLKSTLFILFVSFYVQSADSGPRWLSIFQSQQIMYNVFGNNNNNKVTQQQPNLTLNFHMPAWWGRVGTESTNQRKMKKQSNTIHQREKDDDHTKDTIEFWMLNVEHIHPSNQKPPQDTHTRTHIQHPLNFFHANQQHIKVKTIFNKQKCILQPTASWFCQSILELLNRLQSRPGRRGGWGRSERYRMLGSRASFDIWSPWS